MDIMKHKFKARTCFMLREFGQYSCLSEKYRALYSLNSGDQEELYENRQWQRSWGNWSFISSSWLILQHQQFPLSYSNWIFANRPVFMLVGTVLSFVFRVIPGALWNWQLLCATFRWKLSWPYSMGPLRGPSVLKGWRFGVGPQAHLVSRVSIMGAWTFSGLYVRSTTLKWLFLGWIYHERRVLTLLVQCSFGIITLDNCRALTFNVTSCGLQAY